MPNHQPDQVKLVPVQMKQSFIDRIDSALAQMGYTERSKFIRDAIYEALVARNIPVGANEHHAPSRLSRSRIRTQAADLSPACNDAYLMNDSHAAPAPIKKPRTSK